MKAIRILALFLLSAITMTAQTHKELTLDQLMWGGTGYWQLQPEYLRTAFWGDRLARLEVESVSLIATNKAGPSQSPSRSSPLPMSEPTCPMAAKALTCSTPLSPMAASRKSSSFAANSASSTIGRNAKSCGVPTEPLMRKTASFARRA